MSKRTKESQIKTIHQIQSQVKTYIRWKECGMITKYFKKSNLFNHIYSLNLIFTFTVKNKIASKASKLDHVGMGRSIDPDLRTQSEGPGLTGPVLKTLDQVRTRSL